MGYSIAKIINKSVWEKFNLSFSQSAFFQSWNLGEAESKRGVFVERLGFYDNKSLVGIAQIYKILARRGRFLHIKGGPVFNNWNYLNIFFPRLLDYSKKQKVNFLRISPPVFSDDEKTIKLIDKLSFINVPIPLLDGEVCWMLDLENDPKDIMSRMRKTTRYLIRKAQKSGVIIKRTTDQSSIIKLLHLYQLMVNQKNIVPHQGIKEEFEEFIKDGQAEIYLGFQGNKLLGAALIIYYGNEGIYHHSAHLRTQDNIPVSYLIQWEAILESKRRGMKRYNFFGINPQDNPNHPWAGLTAFKRGFGGYMRSFIRAKDYPLSAWYSMTWLIETIRRIKKY